MLSRVFNVNIWTIKSSNNINPEYAPLQYGPIWIMAARRDVLFPYFSLNQMVIQRKIHVNVFVIVMCFIHCEISIWNTKMWRSISEIEVVSKPLI